MKFASFNLPKEGSAQDADPILWANRDIGIIGTFDGMGGAGTQEYFCIDSPEIKYKGAFLASRIVKKAIDDRLVDDTLNILDEQSLKVDLIDTIHAALESASNYFESIPLNFKNKKLRSFPTTMALMVFIRSGKSWKITSISAGDSRNYVLTTKNGLMQLSEDDVIFNSDKMEDFLSNPPLTNFISADQEFNLNSVSAQVREPFVLVSCTDGSYGCWPTPMHFEKAILDAIISTKSLTQASNYLRESIKEVTFDDASMALMVCGRYRWNDLKKWSIRRRKYLLNNYLKNIASKSFLELNWQSYRRHHLKHINIL